MIPTPEQAWELLCEYNQGEFHQKHGRIENLVVMNQIKDALDPRHTLNDQKSYIVGGTKDAELV